MNNTAGEHGGAIAFLSGPFTNITLSHSTLSRNVAGLMGGAVYSTKATNVMLQNNDMISNIAINGGAFYASECGNITLTTSNMTNDEQFCHYGLRICDLALEFKQC